MPLLGPKLSLGPWLGQPLASPCSWEEMNSDHAGPQKSRDREHVYPCTCVVLRGSLLPPLQTADGPGLAGVAASPAGSSVPLEDRFRVAGGWLADPEPTACGRILLPRVVAAPTWSADQSSQSRDFLANDRKTRNRSQHRD